MSKWPMRGHFRYLRFKTFPMTPITPQFEVFWALLSSSEHSGVPEDSKSQLFQVLGLHPHTWPKWGCDRNPISRKLLNRPPSYPKRYSAQTAVRALRPRIRAQKLIARQDPRSKRTSKMDVHIDRTLCQNMDPIHNKQGNKITKFLCSAINMEREKIGSCNRKPVTVGGLCHTKYDRKVRPQTITAKELYVQSKVLYFFF
jgi:hypothetical protein